MSPRLGSPSVGYDGLRDLPLQDLLTELDRVERLLAEAPAGSCPVGSGSPGRLSRDLAADAVRCRARALEAEIRRRPGGLRRRSQHALETASPSA